MPRWKKGQSGNPRGRLPSSRTLSRILEQKADDLNQWDDTTIDNKSLIAHLLWQFATTGQVSLNGEVYQAENVTDWLNAVRWIYTHIDGPSPTQTDTGEVVIKIERIPPGLPDATQD